MRDNVAVLWKRGEFDVLNHKMLWFKGKNWQKNQPIFALFYRCTGVKNDFDEDLEKNNREEKRISAEEQITKYRAEHQRKNMGDAGKEKFELTMLDEFVVLLTCARIDRNIVP